MNLVKPHEPVFKGFLRPRKVIHANRLGVTRARVEAHAVKLMNTIIILKDSVYIFTVFMMYITFMLYDLSFLSDNMKYGSLIYL